MTQAKKIKNSDRECGVPGKGPAWKEVFDAWDKRLDFKAGREAADLFAAMSKENPRDPDLTAWVARSHFYVGDYANGKKEAGNYLSHAMGIGAKSAKRNPDHIAVNFWTACCIGKYVERVSFIKAAVYAPDVARCLNRVIDQAPQYYFAGSARYIGMSIPRAPKVTMAIITLLTDEYSNERLISELEEALETGPMFVLTLQALAECCWHLKRREKIDALKELLIEAEDRLDESPIIAPENRLDLPRTQEVMRKMR